MWFLSTTISSIIHPLAFGELLFDALPLINIRGFIGKSSRNLTAVFTIWIFLRMLLIIPGRRIKREISLWPPDQRLILSIPGSPLPQELRDSWKELHFPFFSLVLLESAEPNPGPSAWPEPGMLTHLGCLPFLLLIFLSLIFFPSSIFIFIFYELYALGPLKYLYTQGGVRK